MNITDTQNSFVGESMTTVVDHVNANDSASEAVTTMIESGHTAIPVVDHHLHCVGILSRKDFTELFFKEDRQLADFLGTDSFDFQTRSPEFVETCDDLKVSDLMTHDVETVTADTTLKAACKKMKRNGVHHLPVLDGEQKLIGMFSSWMSCV
jgi:CBS domain-containing protein